MAALLGLDGQREDPAPHGPGVEGVMLDINTTAEASTACGHLGLSIPGPEWISRACNSPEAASTVRVHVRV